MWLKKILFSVEVFAVSLILAAFLWLTTVSAERQKNYQIAEISARQVKNSLESTLQAQMSAVLSLRAYWSANHVISHDLFIDLSREIIYRNPAIKAVEFRDANKHVWVEPLPSGTLANNENMNASPPPDEALRQAFFQKTISEKTLAVSQVCDLGSSGKGVMVLAPIIFEGKYQGSIYAVIRLDEIFSSLFDTLFKHRYFCGIYDNGKLIYSSDSALPIPGGKSDIPVRNKINVGQLDLDLMIWPQDAVSGIVSTWMLLMGVLISLMVGAMMWLFSNLSEQDELNGAFQELLHQFVSSPKMRNRLRTIGDTILRVIGVDRCGIFSWNEGENRFEPVWISSDAQENIEGFLSLKLEYGNLPLINQLVDEKRPVLAYGEAAQRLISKTPNATFHVRTLYALPLVSSGKLMGAMTLACIARRHRYSNQEKRWLNSVCGLLGIVIENSMLEDNVKTQLNRVSQQASDFKVLFHQLDNNIRVSVISALGLLSLIKKEIGGQLSSDSRLYLNQLQNSLNRLESLVDESALIGKESDLPRQ
jgi:hypothetical protein